MMITTFAKGDKVRVTYSDRTVTAVVILASDNGHGLVVDWTRTDDGMLGGHAGMMPILFQPSTGRFHALIDGEPVTLDLIGKAHE